MFTGIIESIGAVVSSKKQGKNLVLVVQKPRGWRFKLGESIALNGACSTVVNQTPTSFTVVLMPETLALTIFGGRLPQAVNLERPLRLNALVGGHLVLGHIDTMGTISKIVNDKKGWLVTIVFPKSFSRLIVPKGSIALNGVSLTIAKCAANAVTVALIPLTLTHTVFGKSRVGDKVNIEFDIIGKYALKNKVV